MDGATVARDEPSVPPAAVLDEVLVATGYWRETTHGAVSEHEQPPIASLFRPAFGAGRANAPGFMPGSFGCAPKRQSPRTRAELTLGEA